MAIRQVPLCWPEPVCSVSGYSSMSLVSALSGHAEGTDTPQLRVILYLQYAPGLSGTAAHLWLRYGRLRGAQDPDAPAAVLDHRKDLYLRA